MAVIAPPHGPWDDHVGDWACNGNALASARVAKNATINNPHLRLVTKPLLQHTARPRSLRECGPCLAADGLREIVFILADCEFE